MTRRRLAVLSAITLLLGCGGGDTPPTAPTPATPAVTTPDFSGRWEGYVNITRATVPAAWQQPPMFVSCEGIDACRGLGQSLLVRADFMQTGTAVTGTVTTQDPEPPNLTFTVQDGQVSADGALRLTFEPQQVLNVPFPVQIEMSWEVRLNEDVLTGTAKIRNVSDVLEGEPVLEACLGPDAASCSGWRRP